VPTVKAGQHIEKGQILTDGSADLADLFEHAGKEKTQEYIIAEVLKIYELQGASISIKHLETIIRQMFSRSRIVTAGDTEYSAGEVASHAEIATANAKLPESAEKATGKPLVMGILDVSLSRASFLSAASFQNTTRMLIKAAMYGSVDHLEGLKENVIIGRLIPAGTGFKGSPKERMVNKYAPTGLPSVREEKVV
jgi:DNA-directed RNA polymerase subunit beta'